MKIHDDSKLFWNNLDNCLKESPKFITFKYKLRKHLLSTYVTRSFDCLRNNINAHTCPDDGATCPIIHTFLLFSILSFSFVVLSCPCNPSSWYNVRFFVCVHAFFTFLVTCALIVYCIFGYSRCIEY